MVRFFSTMISLGYHSELADNSERESSILSSHDGSESSFHPPPFHSPPRCQDKEVISINGSESESDSPSEDSEERAEIHAIVTESSDGPPVAGLF